MTQAATGAAPIGIDRSETLRAWLLVGPAMLFIGALFVLPLIRIVVTSVTDPTVSLRNYVEFFSAGLYARVLANTIYTAFTVTVCCLLLGYPLA